MTRFALLPLAFFANACADTEALNSDLNDDLRVDAEDFGNEEARTAESLHMVTTIVRAFEANPENKRCEALGMVHITADSNAQHANGFIIDRQGYVVGVVEGTAIKTNGDITELQLKTIDERGLVITQAWLEIDTFETVALGEWTSRGATPDQIETYDIDGSVKTRGSVQEVRATVAHCR
jgi:hypothetical protein